MHIKNETKWVLYDWANSVYATSVVAGFFPIIFRKYWAKELPSEEITLLLGTTNSLISLILFCTLPFLGYILDSKIKTPSKLLFFTALLGGLTTCLFCFTGENETLKSLALYTFSFIFFALGNTQCDALLHQVSSSKKQEDLDSLSSKGYLFGYLGGGSLLILQALILIFHKKLGFTSSLTPAKLSFFLTGSWWVLFSTPLLFLKIKNKISTKSSFLKNMKTFLSKLSKKNKYFLISFFLYIDVVFTTYKMAANFGLSIGLSENQLIGALIYVQIIGVPGTLFFIWLSKKINTVKAINMGLILYTLAILLSAFTSTPAMFFLLASLIGFAQGGVQGLSRSYFSNMIPSDQQGVGFGFFNVFGKLSAILGPLLVGLSAYLLKDDQNSMIILIPFLLLGMYFLNKTEKIIT